MIDVFLLDDSPVCVSGYRGYIGSKFISQRPGRVVNLSNVPAGTTLLHLAARADLGADSVSTLSANIILDANVIETVAKNGLKLVYSSTNNVYPLKLNCKVGDEARPDGGYSLSKFIGESMCAGLESREYTVIRIADVFGAGQRHGNFFRAIENSLKNGTVFNLSSKSFKVRSYIYIDELCNILDFIVGDFEHQGEIYNLCHKTPMSLSKLAENIYIRDFKRLLNGDEVKADLFDVRTMCQSKVSGYSYRFDMEEALEHYVCSIKED
ncbi:NAD-dependent epimerase/dehydratase family protein [Pontibacterium sp.]|uniref:NAD-dependent epimerase/dehydratase family protein n=1 Tax=Pontibacterium sp. TaxID=2036026 RepID=UPI00351124E2